MKLKRKVGLIFYAIPIFILVIILLLELGFAKKSSQSEGVAYTEKSNITYKVLLKPNNYYEKEYLDDKYNVVASLIDKFIVNYNYVNTFSSEMDYKVKYNVTASLVIYDSDNSEKPIYTKNYVLVDDKEIKGKGLIAIVDLLNNDVNYDEYSAIVNQLKREVIPDANLIIKFNTVFEGNSELLDKPIKSSKTSTLTIPVSQKTINVDIKKDLNAKEEFVNSHVDVDKKLFILIVATIIVLVLLVIKYIMYVVKTAKKKTKYDQAVNKILREFDRAITEARGKLRLDRSNNTIEVKDFMELLDVHDNFNIPIVYYKINNYMCVFLVRNNNDIYYTVMKSDDYN